MSAASAFSSSPWFIDPARIVHIRKIGDGGFAEVYESTLDGDTSNLVAAKHAKGIVTLVGSGLRRFTTEVDMIYKLNHPNIVKTRGACLGKRQNMLIMDLHPGSLRDVIDLANSGEPSAPPPLPWQDRVRILAQLADGIKYLHENKIIHRDLKAANVLVSDDLQPKIADFGFAHTKTSSTQTSVRPGQTVGTTAWMAPEVFNGCFSNTTDVWGLACIAIELITYDDSPFMGRFPSGEQLVSYLKDGTGDVDFGAKSWAVASSDLAAGKHNCSINDPSAGCPPTLVKILATCFDRDYNNRPSAAAVAKSLHALLAGLNPIHSTRCMDSFYAPSLPAAACRSVVDALVDKRNAYAESAVPDAGASHMDFTLASASLGDKSRAIVMAAGEQAQREKAARTAEKQRADALEKRLKELQLDREKEEEARRKRDKEEEERRRKEREEEEAARKKRLQEEEEARERRNKEDEERRRKDREEDERRQREFRERERRLNEEALAARRAAESASYSSYTPSYSSYTPSYSYAPAPAPAPAPAAPRSSGGVFSGSYHSSSGSANGRALYTGPRGGTYYHTASGGKKYV